VNRELAEKIANTMLYEGYMLYPYRLSSVKNQQRWNFGTLYPPEYEEVRSGTERSTMHIECLLAGASQARVSLRLRFLQLSPANKDHAERSLELQLNAPGAHEFKFPGITGRVRFSTAPFYKVLKLTMELANETPIDPSVTRDEALVHSLLSAHVILYAEGGEFVSLLDPPVELREAVAGCRNAGCFPVLVGEEGDRQMLLCSPIILYDYPQVAPESAGDFFDATEMDEMLTLRVLTLTPEEKQAMRESDERARALLERTEQTAREQLARVHGAVRSMRPVTEP
jgi:hypothetical protein